MTSTNSHKKIIKNIFNKFGLDIRRNVPEVLDIDKVTSALKNFRIDLVLDVGANIGQFATDIRARGYAGDIISFEPLFNAHIILQQKSLNDARWTAHSRCAIGANNGDIEINISGNSVSSSVLPMLDSHLSAAPNSSYIGKETVPLITLDSLMPEVLKNSNNPFLKIDTQGFEEDVLNGARNLLPHIRGISLELSLVPLYEGQCLWQEMMSRLNAEGFVLWAILPCFSDPRNGKTLQVDGVFFRE
jgi:FkbM family methyltransferase